MAVSRIALRPCLSYWISHTEDDLSSFRALGTEDLHDSLDTGGSSEIIKNAKVEKGIVSDHVILQIQLKITNRFPDLMRQHVDKRVNKRRTAFKAICLID
ncbi:hypothetical protein TNCV_4481281 [Trichonephila clavipes]|nr:hypothetical protein TNCV_4481281 [Trichonephila clavipes]